VSEQELREGLRVAVLDEPPLAIDPDALMARAHRETARRRALVGAGVATTAVAVAAVAVPTVLGSPRGGGAGGAGWATSCGSAVPSPPAVPSMTVSLPNPTEMPKIPSIGATFDPPSMSAPPTKPADPSVRPEPSVPEEPCPSSSLEPPSPQPTDPSGPPSPPQPTVSFDWPPAKATPVHYTAAELTRRGTEMRNYLRTVFPKVVPDATDVVPGVFGGEAAGAVADGQTYLDAFTGFTLAGNRSAVDVWVSAPGATEVPLPSEECLHGIVPVCAPKQLDNGGWVVIKSERIGTDDRAILSVTNYRPNGTVVRVTAYDYDPLTFSAPTKIPVTDKQLMMLATDPELGL
jgi:hypothetical protein